MTVGGSGFHVLNYQNQRLAYLRVKEERTVPGVHFHHLDGNLLNDHPANLRRVLPPTSLGVWGCTVYELWNDRAWQLLAQRYLPHQNLIAVLRGALNDGHLELKKFQKSPDGAVYETVYDLSGVQLQGLVDASNPMTLSIAGMALPQHFRLTPAPQVVMTTATHAQITSIQHTPTSIPPGTGGGGGGSGGGGGGGGGAGTWAATWTWPSPAPEQSPAEGIEIEVGRYALRSFDLSSGRLGSLFQGDYWDNGVAIAVCKAHLPCAKPPTKDCKCGLYGTLTLDQLVREYPKRAARVVAVFAAEGKTMLGTKGLRTAAARVVAYWCASALEKEVLAANAPEARHFEVIEDMLAEYKFPAYTADGYHDFAPYNPNLPEPPYRFGHPSAPPSTGKSWTNVAPLMTAATAGGQQVVKDLLGAGAITPRQAAIMAPTLHCGQCHQPVAGCSCAQQGYV